MRPAGCRDRQHGTCKPGATPGQHAETPLSPQDGRPDGSSGHVVGGFNPGDIQMRAERRPQVIDAFAHPSHLEGSRPDALGQDLVEPRLHPACPGLIGPQGHPVLNEGGPARAWVPSPPRFTKPYTVTVHGGQLGTRTR